MNVVELLICVFIVLSIFIISSNNIFKLLDLDFSYYFFETAVYSGLWKGNFAKTYSENSCFIERNNSSVNFKSACVRELNGLQVVSFQSARSNTYRLKNSLEITIEPILFEVSKGR